MINKTILYYYINNTRIATFLLSSGEGSKPEAGEFVRLKDTWYKVERVTHVYTPNGTDVCDNISCILSIVASATESEMKVEALFQGDESGLQN